MFLKIKLNFYRFNFPRGENGKVKDLSAVLRLLDKLLLFRSEVLEINSFETFADIVQDCAIKCHELTYSNVFQECEEYQGRSSINESMDEYSTELVPGLTTNT